MPIKRYITTDIGGLRVRASDLPDDDADLVPRSYVDRLPNCRTAHCLIRNSTLISNVVGLPDIPFSGADLTDLSMTFQKRRAETRFVFGFSTTCSLVNGLAGQVVAFGLRFRDAEGVDRDSPRAVPGVWSALRTRQLFVGFGLTTPGLSLPPGDYTIRPFIQIASNATVAWYGSEDHLTYLVTEAA